MSGIRPRVTLPAEALSQPSLPPRPQPTEAELQLIRRAHGRAQLLFVAGIPVVVAAAGGLLAGPLLAWLAVLLGGLVLVAAGRRGIARATGPAPGGDDRSQIRWWHPFHGGDAGGWGGFDGGGGGGDGGGGC